MHCFKQPVKRRYPIPVSYTHLKDELILQSTFADLEDFYETIVLPPPARKPKGKPTVENHVRYLETHLIEKLKEKIYVSFEDLNADIKK